MTKRLSFFFMFMAIALLLLPAASQAENTSQTFPIDARVGLNGLEGLIEQQLNFTLASLKALAATEDATSGDWNRMRPPLEKLATGMPAQAAIWFARPDGAYFTVEKGLTDQNLKDRTYFPRLMGGEDIHGELVVSKSTGKKSAIVATPLTKDGRVIGALGMSVSDEALSAIVQDTLRLPGEIVFYALDQRGQTALHRDSKLMFEFPSEMGSPSLASAVKTMLTEPQGAIEYEFRGKKKLVIFKRSVSTGWVFAVGIEK